jgi:hypothetical protein
LLILLLLLPLLQLLQLLQLLLLLLLLLLQLLSLPLQDEERRLRAEQDALAEERKRLQHQDEQRKAAAEKEAAAAESEKRHQEELVRTVLSDGAPVSLPMALIRTWTENFSHELDRGAFGVVYKGLVTSARGGAGVVASANGSIKHACYIAVKNFNIDTIGKVVNSGGADTGNKKDFNPFIDSVMREIQVLSSFNHPNIIRLVGYSLPTEEQCRDSNVSPTHACLVYDFASRGGLHKVLQDDGSELSWLHRLKVRSVSLELNNTTLLMSSVDIDRFGKSLYLLMLCLGGVGRSERLGFYAPPRSRQPSFPSGHQGGQHRAHAGLCTQDY